MDESRMKLPKMRSLRNAFQRHTTASISPVRDWGILLASSVVLFIASAALGAYLYLGLGASVEENVVRTDATDHPNKDDVLEILELLRSRRTQVEERAQRGALTVKQVREELKEEDLSDERATSSVSTFTPVIAE